MPPDPSARPTPPRIPRRILVCPQEFKGSMTASAAADAIAEGIRAALPGVDVVSHPMADGGPGTMEIIAAATGASLVTADVADAYGHPVRAQYALLEGASDGPTAVADSAAAVALSATPEDQRTPLRSTSRGVGELVRAAVERGARSIILGVGGTASSDGGAGAARALGLHLRDADGQELPDEALHLSRLAAIADRTGSRYDSVRVRVAVDVRNPLTGPTGAAAVFGAQKGLQDWQAPALDAAIRHWAAVVRSELHREIESIEGTGAGGGIPAGILAAIPHATIESGAALVAEITHLGEAIAASDLVVTGEGALDAQTGYGKAVAHVIALATHHGVPCLVVAGTVEARPNGVADAEPLARTPAEVPGAIASPTSHTRDAAVRLIRRWIARSDATEG